jgi:hypothetical protein
MIFAAMPPAVLHAGADGRRLGDLQYMAWGLQEGFVCTAFQSEENNLFVRGVLAWHCFACAAAARTRRWWRSMIDMGVLVFFGYVCI